MIHIDFQAGAHGNFLEFVCNRHLGDVLTLDTPFNTAGASHHIVYLSEPLFRKDHYTTLGKLDQLRHCQVISIQITHDDLLPLSAIWLLRADDCGIDNDQLEINTYHKLNNVSHQGVLETLINSFFKNQIKQSYDAVKDPTWPDVNSIDDFNALPDWIKDECKDQHSLELLVLDEHHPHCERHVLREFFKIFIGFKDPENSGFIQAQHKMQYHESVQTYVFPFDSFYDSQKFVGQIQKLGNFCGMSLIDQPGMIRLHEEFLSRQPYKNIKASCDNILTDIINGKTFDIPKLDLMCESYLTAKLELYYNIDINWPNREWFKTSTDIKKVIDERRH